MSSPIKVELSKSATKLLKDLQEMPTWVLDAIASGMARANELTLSHIRAKHLTGRGPFPVAEHRVGVKTGNLRVQSWASKPVIEGTSVKSAIGDPVKYAKLHEFGGTIHFPARRRDLRFKTQVVYGDRAAKFDKEWNLLSDSTGQLRGLKKQGKNGHLWVFAKKNDKHAETLSVEGKPYDVTYPARAMFRTGIAERMDSYGSILSSSLLKRWKDQASA